MRILGVDDEESMRSMLESLIELQDDYEGQVCDSAESAIEVLKTQAFDLVLTDHQMPGKNGMELIQHIKQTAPETTCLLMTAYGSVNHAVEAIKAGADDYLLKPFEVEELVYKINRSVEIKNSQAERIISEERSQRIRMIGESEHAKQMSEFVDKVCEAKSSVLLLGSSGTGKEVMARSIHQRGPTRRHPFVAVNCAALSPQLLEAELFGHERGAFTGADRSKQGRFELAGAGTIFLDEIGEIPPELQAKLLRVLQDQEFYRVGGKKLIKTHARVIAATNRDLEKMVAEGTFREDLFYRLNVLTFRLKSLAFRKEDIPHLVDYFWNLKAAELGSRSKLDQDVIQLMTQHDYRGNIRELQNMVERILVLCGHQEMIGAADLPPDLIRIPTVELNAHRVNRLKQGVSKAELDKPLADVLEDLEREILDQAWRQTNGNLSQASKLLKTPRTSLSRRIKKLLNLDAPDSEEQKKSA